MSDPTDNQEEKKPKKKKAEDIPERYGMILWTDGGAAPTNPGPAGYGFHGYMFNAVKPKKGSGNPDHVLTTQGYVLKSDFNKLAQPEYGDTEWQAYLTGGEKATAPLEVTPLHYVDSFGSFPKEESNNLAELMATQRGLEYARDYAVKSVQVYTDSKYVQEGITQWVPKWVKNNWIKRDGNVVANADAWKQLIASRDQLQNQGIKVRFDWVKGHNDHLGNEKADTLATIGVKTSIQHLKQPDERLTLSDVTSSTAEGYWKYDVARHPLIANRRMYFNTDPQFITPGEYYLGEHGKDDELLGKRIATGAYSVVILKTPDAGLEMLRNRQVELSKGFNTIVMAKLDEFYRPDTHQLISAHGNLALVQPSPYRLDLMTLSKKPLTRELNPARLAMRAADAIGDMTQWLKWYETQEPRLCVTDLTAIIYESIEKPAKKVKGSKDEPAEVVTLMKLKEQYNQGFASLQVDAQYLTDEGVATAPVILVLGIDLVDRNTLKRLEESKPKISLITWMEAPKVFRYATVIEAGEDKGIWSGYYSNTRVLTK